MLYKLDKHSLNTSIQIQIIKFLVSNQNLDNFQVKIIFMSKANQNSNSNQCQFKFEL
jgi:hypothetical protein